MIPTNPYHSPDPADDLGCARPALSFDAQLCVETVDRIGNPTAYHVALELLAASDSRGEATAPIDNLILVAAASRSSVKRALRRLEADGILTRIPQTAPSGATMRNRYRLTLPARWQGGQP